MVKCPRCGYDNPDSTRYCRNCAYLLSDSKGNKISMVKRESSWNISLAKKIIIVLGIIILIYLLFTVVYNNTQPSNQESLNVITDNGSHLQSSSYPYKVVVHYDGSWYSQTGDPNYLVKKSESGNKTIPVDCAAWERVCVDVKKQDSGNGELKVQLIRNGDVVAQNSTNKTNGEVVIHYNY